MSQRHAVTKAIATRYKRADKAGKGRVLDELCATTGWHRNHARKALGQALKPGIVRPRKPRSPLFGAEVVGALRLCWAVLGAPTGRRPAPVLGEPVPTLRRFGEFDVSEEVVVALRGCLRPLSTAASPLTGRNWRCGVTHTPSPGRC
jgi:hypothetical protein